METCHLPPIFHALSNSLWDGCESGNLFTLSFWVNVSSSGTGVILEHDIIGTVTNDWHMGLDGTSRALFFSFGNSIVKGNIPVADSSWHHVAITRNRDSGNISFYVDGQLDSSQSGWTNDLRASTALNFGPYDTPTGWANNGFVGLLDEMRVYNRALAADEINRLYSVGID